MTPYVLDPEIRAAVAAAEAAIAHRASIAPHPSRSAFLCHDCLHAVQDSAHRNTYCAHPTAPVSLINGTACVLAFHMRQDQRDCTAPRGVEVCGPMGRLFQPAAVFPLQAAP